MRLFRFRLLYGDFAVCSLPASVLLAAIQHGREASTLSLATCHAGFFPGVVLIVGETSNVPDILLALLFFHPHPQTGLLMVVPNQEPKKPRKTRAKPNDSHPRSLPVAVPTSSAPLTLINPDAAGIDVHSNMHMVCVPADRDANPVKSSAATCRSSRIAAWLKKCGVKQMAMESTGVYWTSDSLNRRASRSTSWSRGNFPLAAARPKTDVLDAWIQRLHS